MNPIAGRRLGIALLLSVALAACQGRAPQPAVVTIVHINDAHEMVAADAGRKGGLARVATLVKELRQSAPPVVFTLGGDFLSPSAIGTAPVDGEPLAGRQAVAVLNAMGLEWATFGNHEFDIDEKAFRTRLTEMRFTLISSNVSNAAGQPFEGIPRSGVATVRAAGRDLRIGFIGLTLPFNRRPWVRYADIVSSARPQVAALGRVDALVALTHQNMAEDEALLAEMPEIDLVLGGHEHSNWVARRGERFSPIVKADSNGGTVAVVSLEFAEPGAPVTISPRLEVMDERVKPDAEITAELDRWLELGFAAFRQQGFEPTKVVGTTAEPLDGRSGMVRSQSTTLTRLITAAIAREAGEVNVAIMNGGSIRVDDILPAGPITEYDVIRMLPFGGKILKATFEGRLLARVLDVGLENTGSGGFIHTLGATRQAGEWWVGGKPLNPSARYVVALPEFLLTGGETRMAFLTRDNRQVANVRELRDIRQAVITELRAGATRPR
jgi:5'-nucleotidase